MCSRPAVVWVAPAVSSLKHLRFSSLSLVFTFSILSLAQPIVSLVGCYVIGQFLQAGVVFYSDLNMLTAPGLPICMVMIHVQWLAISYAVQQQNVQHFELHYYQLWVYTSYIPLWWTLKNPTQLLGVASLASHFVLCISILTFLTPRHPFPQCHTCCSEWGECTIAPAGGWTWHTWDLNCKT